MGCKDCIGKYGLMVTAVAFSFGVIISCTSPSWLKTTHENPVTGTTLITEFGPMYSRNQTCSELNSATPGVPECTDWTMSQIESEDCDFFALDDPEQHDQICTQHTAWRGLAMVCFAIVVGTGALVIVATCTSCITCGCCGGSFAQVAMLLYWIEVILSIACWSLCINVVSMLNGEDVQGVLWDEFENLSAVNLTGVTADQAGVTNLENQITDGNFLWGFWIFLFSGTILGAMCAIFADWAGEGSLLQCLCSCLTCGRCCAK